MNSINLGGFQYTAVQDPLLDQPISATETISIFAANIDVVSVVDVSVADIGLTQLCYQFSIKKIACSI